MRKFIAFITAILICGLLWSSVGIYSTGGLSRVFMMLGETSISRDDSFVAGIFADLSINILENDPAKQQELSKAYLLRAHAYLDGDCLSAKEYFKKAKTCATEKSLEWVRSNCELGFLAFGNWDEAERCYFDAYEGIVHLENQNDENLDPHIDELQSYIMKELKDIYFHMLSPSDAKERLEDRIKEFQEANTIESLILAHTLLSVLAEKKGDNHTALTHYEQIAEITSEIDYGHLAYLYEINSEWDKAIAYFYKALHQPCDLAWVYHGIGYCNFKRGKLEESKIDYLVACRLYQEDNNHNGEATVMNNIASIYYDQKRSAECIEYAKRASDIVDTYRSEISENTVADIYDTLATGYELDGQLKLAEQFFLKTIDVKKSDGDALNTSPHYISLGNIYLKQNRREKARECWKEGRKFLDKDTDRELLSKIKFNLENDPIEIPRVQL